jgi:hypothetical protein
LHRKEIGVQKRPVMQDVGKPRLIVGQRQRSDVACVIESKVVAGMANHLGKSSGELRSGVLRPHPIRGRRQLVGGRAQREQILVVNAAAIPEVSQNDL